MRIAVLGVGAIGGMIGAALARAGQDITLIDTWPANIERIKERGLKVSSAHEEYSVRPRARHLGEVFHTREQFDAVILCAKAYDTEWLGRFIEPHLAPDGFTISAQNGMNDAVLARIVGWARIIGCVVMLGGGMYEPGHVLRTGDSESHLIVGEPSGRVTPRLKVISKLLDSVSPTRMTTNLWGERWAKLAASCISWVNAHSLGAGLDRTSSHTGTEILSILVISEVVRVATALGVYIETIAGIPAPKFLRAGEDATMRSVLSKEMRKMAMDAAGRSPISPYVVMGGRRTPESQYLPKALELRRGRRSEVDDFNGYVTRKGRQADMPTPANDAVLELAARMESETLDSSVIGLGLEGFGTRWGRMLTFYGLPDAPLPTLR